MAKEGIVRHIDGRLGSRERGSSALSTVGVLAILGLGSFAIFGDSTMDIMGDLPHQTELSQPARRASAFYKAQYSQLSPAAKLAVQYSGARMPAADCDLRLPDTDTCIDEYGQVVVPTSVDKGGNGILGRVAEFFSSSDKRAFKFGASCLAGTGYDTTPSEIRIGGFASGGGDISAVATINPRPEGKEGLMVLPASGVGEPLTFDTRADGSYSPGDSQTSAILSSYGCDPSLTAFEAKPAQA